LKTAKPWRRKRHGKEFGSYYGTVGGGTVNLQTKESGEALKRLRLARAGKWEPAIDEDEAEHGAELEEARAAAAAVDEAMAGQAAGGGHGPSDGATPSPAVAPPAATPTTPPAALPPVPPPAAPVQPDDVIPPKPAEGWEKDAQAAAADADSAGTTASSGAAAAGISNEEAAKLFVWVSVRGVNTWTRVRVYKGFSGIEISDEAKNLLVDNWTTILDYANFDDLLPAWLLEAIAKGLVPAATIIASMQAMAAAAAAEALKQKAAAEAQKAAGV